MNLLCSTLKDNIFQRTLRVLLYKDTLEFRPGTILYQNDRYDVLRTPLGLEIGLSSNGGDFAEFRRLGIK